MYQITRIICAACVHACAAFFDAGAAFTDAGAGAKAMPIKL